MLNPDDNHHFHRMAVGQTGYDELADIDRSPNMPVWLAMLKDMWSGRKEKEQRYAEFFRHLTLRPGARVLEVGCGGGGAGRFLAGMHANGIAVVGVDPSEQAIALASALTREAGMADVVTFREMDGRRLDFADGDFDAAFCARTLVHAHEPKSILSEMIRVVRPGGQVLAIEPDRDCLISTAPRDEVNRLFWSTRRSVNPQVGRFLYPLFVAAGLADVKVIPSFQVSTNPPSLESAKEIREGIANRSGDYWEMVAAGIADRVALEEYADGIEEAARTGVFLRCDLEFCVVGRKVA